MRFSVQPMAPVTRWLVLLSLALLIPVGPAEAAIRYWDGGTTNLISNGDGVSAGGSGIWNTAIQNWDQGSGQPHVAWNDAGQDTAVFGGTAGTVIVGEEITVGGLRLDAANYVLTGNTVTFGMASTVTAVTNATLAVPVAGRWALTKAGSGALTLTGSNVFTGPFMVEAGTLTIGQSLALPALASGIQVRNRGVTYISKTNHISSSTSEPGAGAQWAAYWSVYSVTNVADVLDNFATQYPQWAARGFVIAGYVWLQGNRDINTGPPYTTNCETNMVNFIKQVRAYYAHRYPGKCTTNTPFVLATGCGDPQTNGNGLVVANAQLAVGDPVKHPEFAGNVKTMDIRGYWRDVSISPTTAGSHYNGNAETFMLVGDALGPGPKFRSFTFAPGPDYDLIERQEMGLG